MSGTVVLYLLSGGLGRGCTVMGLKGFLLLLLLTRGVAGGEFEKAALHFGGMKGDCLWFLSGGLRTIRGGLSW